MTDPLLSVSAPPAPPRVAVVTGAASGIGAAIARRLAQAKFLVVAVDRDAKGVEAIAREVGGLAETLDIGDHAAVRGLAQNIMQDFGAVHALVNNAAIWRIAEFDDVTPQDAEDVLRTNVLGPWNFAQSMSAVMPSGSAIVNIASTVAALPGRGLGLYPSSKGAVVSMTRQLAVELGERGIRVNAIAPGLILTPPTEEAYATSTYRELAARLPVPRVGSASEVADVVTFLIESATYMTGQVLTVDGGWTLVGGP